MCAAVWVTRWLTACLCVSCVVCRGCVTQSGLTTTSRSPSQAGFDGRPAASLLLLQQSCLGTAAGNTRLVTTCEVIRLAGCGVKVKGRVFLFCRSGRWKRSNPSTTPPAPGPLKRRATPPRPAQPCGELPGCPATHRYTRGPRGAGAPAASLSDFANLHLRKGKQDAEREVICQSRLNRPTESAGRTVIYGTLRRDGADGLIGRRSRWVSRVDLGNRKVEGTSLSSARVLVESQP